MPSEPVNNNNNQPGGIYNLKNYMRGKLLNHQGWFGKLPRKITPSDIDFVFDNGKCQLLCELNSKAASWAALPTGQRLLYTNLVKNGYGMIEAACCWHLDTPTIDTTDITAFQVMRWGEHGVYTLDIMPGSAWVGYVTDFFRA